MPKPNSPCGLCGARGCPWDLLDEIPVCPDCEEALALGEAAPLALPLQAGDCAGCGAGGTVPYATYPRHCKRPLDVPLCAPCFRALLGRRLRQDAHARLSAWLALRALRTEDVFLLSGAYYDETGLMTDPLED